jgi:hypothetical protein
MFRGGQGLDTGLILTYASLICCYLSGLEGTWIRRGAWCVETRTQTDPHSADSFDSSAPCYASKGLGTRTEDSKFRGRQGTTGLQAP